MSTRNLPSSDAASLLSARRRTPHRVPLLAVTALAACLQSPAPQHSSGAAPSATGSGSGASSGGSGGETTAAARSGSDRLTAPPPVQHIVEGFALEITKPDDDTVLVEWEDQEVEDYEVWESADPYFEPGDAGSTMVTTTSDLYFSTTASWEKYYRIVAPGAEEELSTTVGQIPYALYKYYTKLGVCLVSEVDYWPELESDMTSAPSNAFM